VKLVEKASGKLVDVPDEQAAQAFSSGNYGVPKGQPVPVVGSDGTVGTVAPEHLQAVLEGGGRFASEQELHKATLHEKYGGLGAMAVAAGEGAARGITLGLSDPLAIGAGRLFGGKSGEKAVREHLSGEKEENPWLSTGAEIAGAGVPMLLSGGTAAPAVGALEDAGAIARIGEGVRKLGVLPRAVGALGDYAEHAVSGVLGAPGASVLGRAAQSAAKVATRGIVEGGLFGAGQEISESALQDHELTGEKLAASVGHSAMLGGILGGGLGAFGKLAGEGVSAILGKASPALDDAAGRQTWNWLQPRVAEARLAARAGGVNAVGRAVFDEVLKPLVEKEGLQAALMAPEEKLGLVARAADRKGAEIGELTRGMKGAEVSLGDMLKPIQEREAKMAGQVLGGDKAAALRTLREDLVRILGVEGEALPAPVRVPRSNAEIGKYLRANPDAAAELAATGALPERAQFMNVQEPIAKGTPELVKVPIADAIAQRRALQQRVFQETKALDPKLRVELMREVSHEWNELEVKTLNKVGEEMGKGLEGDRFRELNKTFQRLTIAEDALKKTTAAYASNRTLSLADTLWGTAHAAGAIASGHPLGALGAIGTSYAHKAIRMHGNAYAALMLDRLATWGGVSRATAEVDEQVDRAVEAALNRVQTGPYRGGRARLFRTETPSGEDRRFEQERSRVERLASLAPGLLAAHLQQRTAPVATHAPNVAQQMAATTTKATQFLAAALPAKPMPAGLTPQLEKPSYPTAAKQHLLRSVEAIEGGPPGILERLGQGTLTAEDVAAMQQVWPKQYAEISVKLAMRASKRAKPIALQQSLHIARFLNAQTDPTQTPQVLQGIQRAYAAHPQRASMPRSTAPKLSIAKSLMGPFETAQRGGP
jgi:hypothetical protein